MLEFVYEITQTGYPALVAEQAGQLAAQPFEALGIQTDHRPFDIGEQNSLETATNEDGIINLRDFIICQAIHRDRLGISSRLRTVSAIYGPAVVAQTQNCTIEPYGYSIEELREATLSTHNLRMQLLENPKFNESASHFFAYTMAHEAGHLFGLVKSSSDRYIIGKHCCNDCVMQSTSIHGTASYLDRHNGSIVFCDPCIEDISDQIDQNDEPYSNPEAM